MLRLSLMLVASMHIMNVSFRSQTVRRLLIYLSEDEFGQWKPICNRFGDEYLTAYHSYVQVSAPKEDYEGRLDLYKL